MQITLRVWRQAGPSTAGSLVSYDVPDVSPEMSFLEMLDVLNERLINEGEAADRLRPRLPRGDLRHLRPDDQRRGARPGEGDDHLPAAHAELPERRRDHGGTVARRGVPRAGDLVVDRRALDRIIASGGFISANTGGAPDGNAIPVPKPDSDSAMDAAACIGCGACVAACPNGSASLFTAAKVTHLGFLPQGQAERYRRALSMVQQMDIEHFGSCTLYGECMEACPKEISIDTITRMNGDFLRATAQPPVKEAASASI